MSEGPYRDLGRGFARLTGAEAPRRAPSPITCVEDALYEMLRNSRDSGAKNIFVASRLSARRYRTLIVIDDGEGFPPEFSSAIFDPGVTTRYLAPTRRNDSEKPHGAGLSLHHIRSSAVEAHAPNNANPTAIQATFDTKFLPERTLQTRNPTSKARKSTSNLEATTRNFATRHPAISIYYGNPASILATLIKNHIIPMTKRSPNTSDASDTSDKKDMDGRNIVGEGGRVGLEVSVKTAGRILSGQVRVVERLSEEDGVGGISGETSNADASSDRDLSSGDVALKLGDTERAEITAILRRAAAASYLELKHIEFKTRPGEITISTHIEEPEDEYG